VIEGIRVFRRDWLHGEALCPSCQLPIGKRDVTEDVWEVGQSEPVGAVVAHQRCGASFRISFAS